MSSPPAKGRRLSPQARRSQLIEAAAKVALEAGGLPVALDRLGEAAGASRALIYAYFPTQHDLFNAVLAREFEALAAAGLEDASRTPAAPDAAQACALIYFEHIATHGPVIHLILRDGFMAIDAANRGFRDRIMRRLARLVRREHGLSPKEAVAALSLVVTIPEEAGRLAWSGELPRERARTLLTELIAASVTAFDAPSGRPRTA